MRSWWPYRCQLSTFQYSCQILMSAWLELTTAVIMPRALTQMVATTVLANRDLREMAWPALVSACFLFQFVALWAVGMCSSVVYLYIISLHHVRSILSRNFVSWKGNHMFNMKTLAIYKSSLRSITHIIYYLKTDNWNFNTFCHVS